jgi:hypothetical protein
MKKLIVILFLISVFTQLQANPLKFEEVVSIPDVSAKEIYDLAQMWFAETFVSAENVLQLQDNESKMLIGRGVFQYKKAGMMTTTSVNGYISFLIKIFVKEGRYKYVITDFIHSGTNTNYYKAADFGLITTENKCPVNVSGNPKGVCQKNWDKMKKECEINAQLLIKSLKKGISKANLQDNW